MGTKVVNGVRRKLTPEEEAEHEAQKVTSARERPMKIWLTFAGNAMPG